MTTLAGWLTGTILPLNLCPFARAPYEQGLLRLCEVPANTPEAAQAAVLDELEHLNQAGPRELSSTLLGFPRWPLDYREFLDFSQAMEELLEEAGLEQELQLVAFHPQFRLAGFPDESFAHWPNSSPFPVLHFLRSAEVALAADPEWAGLISRANEAAIEALSEDGRRRHFPWKFSGA